MTKPRFPLHRDRAAAFEKLHRYAVPRLTALAELVTLGRNHTPDNDGYPHGGTGDGPRGSDTTSTTERAALTPDDEATTWLAIAIEKTEQAMRLIIEAESALAAYRHPKTPPAAGRTSTVTTCPACGDLALPRVIAGYCPKCYEAWRSSDFPDRTRFENTRTTRAQRAEAS